MASVSFSLPYPGSSKGSFSSQSTGAAVSSASLEGPAEIGSSVVLA